MSGGVDSSVAAALLLRAGFEPVGCFMRLGSPGESLDELTPAHTLDEDHESCDAASEATSAKGNKKTLRIGKQGCCSINDAADARLVAAELGIPLYVCNFKRDFGRVIDYFVDEYAAGRTPNPCVRCNDWLKFGKLDEYARQLGADFVASGHYAQIARIDPVTRAITPRVYDPLSITNERGTCALLRGDDTSKDQSYVLFGAHPTRVERMFLPIGGLPKLQVRDLARTFGLPVFDKPDSQEICFVPDNDYAGLVERKRPGLAKEGQVVAADGSVIGTHAGQHRFTIGQRRGVEVALGHRVYVVGKDPIRNSVTLGPREALRVGSCQVAEANWLLSPFTDSPEAHTQGVPVLVQYRAHGQALSARAMPLSDRNDDSTPSGRRGRFQIVFDQPQEAVAPGQAMVVYDATHPRLVLGGGWIEQTN